MDHSTLSFEIRMVIARMARLVRKFDGMKTGLSDEHDIRELLRVAAGHERTEVRSIHDEMLYLMSREELQYLADSGVHLPDEYAQRLHPSEAPVVARHAPRPRLVYRGQVVRR